MASGTRTIYRGTVYFHETILAMVVHPGTLQERLAVGMQNLMSLDTPGSMPDELMDQYTELVAMTTCRDADTVDIAAPHLKGQGRIVATCMTMTDDEASAAANLIVHLHKCLEELRPL